MKQLLLVLLILGMANAYCQIPIADVPHTQNKFEDLTFLKEELEGKQIVCLGEEWHFTETFSQVKNRLIKYLHQELGYTVVLFESSFQCAWIAESDSLKSKERLLETVQTIWRTESVLNLMDYISESKKGDNPITQYGIDLYGTYSKRFQHKLAAYLNANQPQLSNKILTIEAKFQEEYLAKHRTFKKYNSSVTNQDIEEYKKLLPCIDKDTKSFKTSEDKAYYRRAIENRILLGESLLKNEPFFRENVMSDNINWILNHLGKDEKVIIWAADIHISKAQKRTVSGGDRSMIERLPKEIQDKVYSLSLIPVSSAPRKLKKELTVNKDRFFFYSLSEDNRMSKRKEEFDGIIICKSVEHIDSFKVE